MSHEQYNLCIIQPKLAGTSETFLLAQSERLPTNVTIVHGSPPHIGTRPLLSQSRVCRAIRKAHRMATRRPWEWETTASFLKAFRRCRPDAVLAQYGPNGVRVMEACSVRGVPLVVHFHGYDASMHKVLREHEEAYPRLFEQAEAINAVSHAMKEKLVSLGAPAAKVHYNPCGIDCDHFSGADPTSAEPTFLTVGRFTDKKAPHLTILAFADVVRSEPNARLRMIGDGHLLGACQDLAKGLGIEQNVVFLGARSHDVVQTEMRQARCFVQHSVEALDGDCEGTPVAVLEAGASGLPVVATRHAGIPDVVIENETGFLVDERDVQGMASQMRRLVDDPALAGQLGRKGQERIRNHFSMEQSIGRLWSIIESCIESPRNGRDLDSMRSRE